MKFILSMIFLLIFSCSKEKMMKKTEETITQETKLSIQDVLFSPDFRMESVSGTQWTPEGNGYVYLKRSSGESDLVYYDIETGNESTYIAGSDNILESGKSAKRFRLKNFFWSPANTNEMLIPKETDLYLYYQDSKKLVQLTFDKDEERDPTFSPDGKKVAYLKNNNLYMLDIASKKERKLSSQGTDKVLIGRFDWVYEEEFGIRTGFFWSNDSKEIAYFELTDAETDRFPIVDFIPVKNTVENLPYPKAGADNSTIRIASVSINNGKTVFTDINSDKDELIPRIKWTNNASELLIYKMNRDQDYLELHKTNTITGKSKLIYKEEEKNGWVDVNDDITFIENNKFIWRSRKDGYYHLYLMDLNGSKSEQLTKGNWEITQVHGYDKENKKNLFYCSKKNLH
jgi:dipeptidyl-peptidase 4